MSIERLQAAIRRCKTPLAPAITADEAALSAPLRRQFTEMYGDTPQAVCEALRYRACRFLEEICGLFPAVYVEVASFLPYGPTGLDVAQNIISAAKTHGFYVIADCRTETPLPWLAALPQADGITVTPYSGSDCCRVGEDKAAFVLVRTGGNSSGEVQNLMSGDRRLYAAVAEQMGRHGSAAVVETGFSLDIRELRRRQEKLFLLLTNCTGEAAQYAFDEYGHGALVVEKELQSAQDVATAARETIRGWKGWVSVV